MADYVKHPGIAMTSGTSVEYTVTLDPVPASIPEFFGITIIPHVTNGASPKLNINGLGAITLKDQKGVTYAAGKLLAGKPYMFRKVETDFLVDSGSGGGGNLKPNQALAGFTFTNDDGEQVGQGDSNLIPANILEGKNLFGVIGTLAPGAKYATGTITSGTKVGGTYPFTITGLNFKAKLIIVEVSVSRSNDTSTAEAITAAIGGLFSRQAALAITVMGSYQWTTYTVAMTAYDTYLTGSFTAPGGTTTNIRYHLLG